MDRKHIRQLVLLALFAAMTIILGFVYIPIGPIKMQLVHIPVILGAIVLGWKEGAVLGFMFGITSFIQCFTDPLGMLLLGVDSGFGAYNLLLIIVIIFIPRILVGMFAGLLFQGFSKHNGRQIPGLFVSSAVGTLTNTVLFLGFLYILAAPMLAANWGTDAAGVAGVLFTTTALINGSIELAAALIICPAVGKALLHYKEKHAD